MDRAYRLTAGAEPESRARPAPLARTEPEALRLQRLAGNQAVAGLVQRAPEDPDAPVPLREYHGMARSFALFLNSCKPPFTFHIYTHADDDVGHAWIGINAADGSARTIGFWPADLESIFLVGAGRLTSPDSHAGDEDKARTSAPVPRAQAGKALEAIADYDMHAVYSLWTRNCANFAVDVWRAGTSESVYPGGIEPVVVFWSPDMLAMAGEDLQKKKHLLKQSGGRP